MADLVYDQAKFDELIRRIEENIKKLEGEKAEFEKNYDIIKRNWSGTEFNIQNEKLLEIGRSIDKAISDQRTQKNYLDQKNYRFASQVSGFREEIR